MTTDKEKIKGEIAASLISSVFSVPQRVEADFEIRIGTDSMTREEKLLYTLTAIRPTVIAEDTEK